MNIPKNKIVCFCSGIFLTEEVPLNWEELEYEEQLAWIQDHKWEQVEGMFCDDILDQIECAVNGFEELLKRHGVEVTE